MILIRPKHILTGLVVAGLFIPIIHTANAQTSAGTVQFSRRTDWSFNANTWSQQWLQEHFDRMVVYSPYFDSRNWWYPNALVYVNAYAIYTNSSLVWEHPEWILKDANGNRVYIPWGCSNGTCPQYAGDITNPAFRSYWISRTAAIVANGYKGLFIDDANMEFRIGDGWGNFVYPVDPNTGGLMSWDAWRSYMASYMEQVRSAFPSLEIVHNSIWFAGPAGVRDQDPSIQRMIKASNYQNIEFGVNDGGLAGGTGIWSVSSLLGYIDRVHALGRGAIISGVPVDQWGREYSLAGYFLVSSGADRLDDIVTTPDNWWAGFDVNLGSPSGGRYTWNNLLRRDFSGGMVLMNPPQSGTITVNLPGTFKRVDGTPVTSVTLQAKQGAVLLSTGTVSITPPPVTSGLSVQITSPGDPSTVFRGPIQLVAQSSGARLVHFYLNGAWIGTASGSGSFSVWCNLSNWGPGWYSLSAVADDGAGHTTTTRNSVQLQ